MRVWSFGFFASLLFYGEERDEADVSEGELLGSRHNKYREKVLITFLPPLS